MKRMQFYQSRIILKWVLPGCILSILFTGCELFKDDDRQPANPDNIAQSVTEELKTPWQMVFAPDDRLFVTQ